MKSKDVLILECLEIYKELNKHGFRFRAINRHLLGYVSLSGGRSLTDTADKIKEELSLKSQPDIAVVKDRLIKKFKDFVSFADKEVCVLKLSPSEATSLVSFFNKDFASSNPFNTNFPNLPDAANVSYDKYYTADVEKNGDVFSVCLGSKKRVRERVDLNASDLTQATRHKLSGLEKVAAYTLNDLLSVDVLQINTASGTCEVRLTNASSNNMTNFSIEEAFSFAYKKIRQSLNSNRVIDKKNFYPSIMPLYQDKPTNGTDKVTKFYFEADENGNKKETKPYDRSDLRDELYHGSGSQAINYNFRPYGIRKIWGVNGAVGAYEVGVEVFGSPKVLDLPAPKIDQIKVFGCYNESDYNFLMSKTLPYAV